MNSAMNSKKSVLRAMCALVLYGLSTAAYPVWSGSVYISRVGAMDSGIYILYAEGGWGSAATNSCSGTAGVLAFDVSTDGGKAVLATALAAHAAHKKVTALTDDSTCYEVGGKAAGIRRLDIVE